jgi:hypothetical protein
MRAKTGIYVFSYVIGASIIFFLKKISECFYRAWLQASQACIPPGATLQRDPRACIPPGATLQHDPQACIPPRATLIATPGLPGTLQRTAPGISPPTAGAWLSHRPLKPFPRAGPLNPDRVSQLW